MYCEGIAAEEKRVLCHCLTAVKIKDKNNSLGNKYSLNCQVLLDTILDTWMLSF